MAVQYFLAHLLGQLSYFNRATLVVASTDETLLFERRQMLVHRRKRGQLERVRDLLEARRVAVLIDEAHQVVQYFFLPFCKRHCRPLTRSIFVLPTIGESKAKVNGTRGQVAVHTGLDRRARDRAPASSTSSGAV